jgi:hypothetical protein
MDFAANEDEFGEKEAWKRYQKLRMRRLSSKG